MTENACTDSIFRELILQSVPRFKSVTEGVRKQSLCQHMLETEGNVAVSGLRIYFG